MLQVEILMCDTVTGLQDAVNKEIMKIEAKIGRYKVFGDYLGGRVKDIKYQINEERGLPYSAMIIYQTENDFDPIRDYIVKDEKERNEYLKQFYKKED